MRVAKQLRNRPCKCGSGKKFKRCCQRKEPEPPAVPKRQYVRIGRASISVKPKEPAEPPFPILIYPFSES